MTSTLLLTCSELCAQSLQLYQTGLAIGTVEARLSIPPMQFYTHLRRMHPEIIRSPATRVWHSELHTLWSQGLTFTEIASRVGVSRERVRQVAQRLGLAAHPRRRHHRCGDVCTIIQAAAVPIRIRPLARQTGFSEKRLRDAMRAHQIASAGRRTHICTDRCTRFRRALKTAPSIAAARRKMGIPISWTNRMQIVHREWPWPDPRWWLRSKPKTARRPGPRPAA
jgi:hypothetical protein